MSATASQAESAAISSIPHITSQQDRSRQIFVVSLAVTILATTFVALRIISKTWVVRKVMWDDYITVLAWFFFMALSIAIMIGTHSGLGTVGIDIQSKWIIPLGKITYIFTVFYNPATMTIKLAILFLYRRMSEVQPWFRYGTYATMTIVTLSGVVCTFLAVFQCRPVRSAWHSREEGVCIDMIALFLSTAPINILTDLAILLLPLPILTGLRMEMRQKVALIATFCVGGFVTIVDVVRIAYLQQALLAERIYGDQGTLNASTQFGDYVFFISLSLMWSVIEVAVGLCCSCTLVLKPLVLRVVPAILRKKRDSRMTRQETHALTEMSLSPAKSRSPRSPGFEERGIAVLPAPDEAPHALEITVEDDQDEEGEGAIFDFAEILKQAPPASASKAISANGTRSDPLPLLPADANMDQKDKKRKKRDRSLSVNYGADTNASFFRKRWPTRRSTLSTNQRPHHSQGPTEKFFDFVNMSGNKPLTELSAREALSPILFASILFFLWGFSYGLIGNLNGEVEGLLGYKPQQTLSLNGAYWTAYFIGPTCIGYLALTKKGFRFTFISGLTLYSIGAMAFWPSAVLTSFPGFVISNFLVALGLSTLETAANPFIALAGPGELSEARLLFSQAIQAVGSLSSGLLSQRALFTNVDQMRLFKVQWCYLAVAIFVLILAAVFYYVPLSEATDEDLEIKAHRRFDHAGIEATSKSFNIPTRWLLTVTGIFVMCNYVGSQESIGFTWNSIIQEINPDVDEQWMRTIGQAVFFVSRVISSGACYIGIRPRFVLGTCLLGAFSTSLSSMVLPHGKEATGTMILHMFFEGPIFPLVFAITLRGQGKHTKSTSTGLTAAISAAAFFPAISHTIENMYSNNKRISLALVVVSYGITSFLPIMISLNSNLKKWVDPKWSKKREGDIIAPDHDKTNQSNHQPNYLPETREDLGITSSNSAMVGLGLDLNGGVLKETVSYASMRGIKSFDYGG
ncbi:uncharacterized protein IL334_003729 [Kwoniella shivajii]|uniref:Rhodopsin domain-containing protein n=1 Tax=Kwoniella shivajii TaxID=564305 RepID=A0ABZ1CYQ3_9TREE|nr:hypothetical protein IL334_003729 [Kwoniella shivajii]